MKVRQKDSLRKLQLSDKSALKAADTPVTKVSAAQLHIHKYKLKSCTNLQLPACCLLRIQLKLNTALLSTVRVFVRHRRDISHFSHI